MLSSRRLPQLIHSRGIIVPMVSDLDSNTHSDLYSRLLHDRIILLHGPVDSRTSSLVTSQLIHLDSQSTVRPIRLYINSTGGVVDDGLAIYDTMQFINAPVHTVCMGLAASMASLLLAAGQPGHRVCLANSRVMIHQPLVGAINGQASDVAIRAAEMMRMRDQLVQLYVMHTGKTKEEIERAIDRDNFMSPQQAVKFGLVDRVLLPKRQHVSSSSSGGCGGDRNANEEKQ